MITTVTGKNQITIPAQIARRLEIKQGTRFEWSVSDNEVLTVRVLPPRGVAARAVAGMGQEWLDEDSDPVRDLIVERVQDEHEQGRA